MFWLMLGLGPGWGEIHFKKFLTQEQKPSVRDHHTTRAALFTVKLWKYVVFALLPLSVSPLVGCGAEINGVD